MYPIVYFHEYTFTLLQQALAIVYTLSTPLNLL
jgi:hypothetical protein